MASIDPVDCVIDRPCTSAMCTNRGAGVCRGAARALAAGPFHSVTVSARAKPGGKRGEGGYGQGTRRYRCGFMISPSFLQDDGDWSQSPNWLSSP